MLNMQIDVCLIFSNPYVHEIGIYTIDGESAAGPQFDLHLCRGEEQGNAQIQDNLFDKRSDPGLQLAQSLGVILTRIELHCEDTTLRGIRMVTRTKADDHVTNHVLGTASQISPKHLELQHDEFVIRLSGTFVPQRNMFSSLTFHTTLNRKLQYEDPSLGQTPGGHHGGLGGFGFGFARAPQEPNSVFFAFPRGQCLIGLFGLMGKDGLRSLGVYTHAQDILQTVAQAPIGPAFWNRAILPPPPAVSLSHSSAALESMTQCLWAVMLHHLGMTSQLVLSLEFVQLQQHSSAPFPPLQNVAHVLWYVKDMIAGKVLEIWLDAHKRVQAQMVGQSLGQFSFNESMEQDIKTRIASAFKYRLALLLQLSAAVRKTLPHANVSASFDGHLNMADATKPPMANPLFAHSMSNLTAQVVLGAEQNSLSAHQINQAWQRLWESGSRVPSVSALSLQNDPIVRHILQYASDVAVSAQVLQPQRRHGHVQSAYTPVPLVDKAAYPADLKAIIIKRRARAEKRRHGFDLFRRLLQTMPSNNETIWQIWLFQLAATYQVDANISANHFSNNIQSCGQRLLQLTRNSFHALFSHIAYLMRRPESSKGLVSLGLNVMDLDFQVSDSSFLNESSIFPMLRAIMAPHPGSETWSQSIEESRDSKDEVEARLLCDIITWPELSTAGCQVHASSNVQNAARVLGVDTGLFWESVGQSVEHTLTFTFPPEVARAISRVCVYFDRERDESSRLPANFTVAVGRDAVSLGEVGSTGPVDVKVGYLTLSMAELATNAAKVPKQNQSCQSEVAGNLPPQCAAVRATQVGSNVCQSCHGKYRDCFGSYGTRLDGHWTSGPSANLTALPESPNKSFCCQACQDRGPRTVAAVVKPGASAWLCCTHHSRTTPKFVLV
jgi:hypothetical protein